jgi:hypothetical protein
MAVVEISEFKGDPSDLLPRYDRVAAALKELPQPPSGWISHTCVELPDGFLVANLWETEDQAWTVFNSDAYQQALRAAGLESTGPSVYRVHNYFVPAQAGR